jgi:hypothetical protein
MILASEIILKYPRVKAPEILMKAVGIQLLFLSFTTVSNSPFKSLQFSVF